MPIATTCIGAYPKPDYVHNANWHESNAAAAEASSARGFEYTLSHPALVTAELFDQATRAAILDQVSCGIDIPTDGEQRRENYIHYHCGHLDGIDFDRLTRKVHRNGAAVADLPTINGKILPGGDHFLDDDYAFAQSCTDKPVKLTLPGPVTILDTTANEYYANDRELAFDLASALNFEIRALARAGCRHIQVDEPLFARNVDMTLDFGIECLERCFDGVPGDVSRIMHMCCGYPGHLDDEDYAKADPGSYALLAAALDSSSIDCISLEDAHRHSDLRLLERFAHSTIILGSVAIASSRLESSEKIARRLADALQHIDQDRLIAAPDCGLSMLDRDLAMKKLRNLCHAAQAVGLD
ncbi:MAG: cobalamin-independent methionine synthase II family protein [Gammaproteobacteria bacterium]|nr:cobalamin-independent methionine synthase II family protein [Gammaproteobacteria bacterium]